MLGVWRWCQMVVAAPRWCHVVLVMVLMVLGDGQSVKCPDKCLCFRTTVRCMFLQLDKVPQVPPETTILDLRFNRIKTIPPGTFQNTSQLHTLLLNNNHITRLSNGSFTGLTNLRYLYLYKNRIRELGSLVFSDMRQLEQLYLHFNELATIPANTFANLTSLERLFLHNNRLHHVPNGAFRNLGRLKRLRLDSNALVCDCALLWLARMVQEQQPRTQVAATCHFPSDLQGRNIAALRESEFDCRGMPQITEEPSDVDVTFGGTAYFTCKVEGDPEPEVIWLHNNEVVRGENGGSGRYSILQDGTLMIQDAQDQDTGFYECVASNSAGEVKSRRATMAHDADTTVQVPAATTAQLPAAVPTQSVVVSSTQPQLVSEASTSTFTPEREVLSRQLETSTPQRAVFTPEREVFTPERELSSRQRGIFIPEREVFTPQRGSVQQQIVPRQQEVPQAESGRRGLVFPEGEQLPVAARQVQPRGDESGTRVTTRQATGEATRPRFVVTPGDVIVVLGDPVQMPCEVIGNPRPDVTWSRDSNIVQEGPRLQISNRGMLTISAVELDDAATYRCTAANHLGRVSASALLKVFVPPRFTHTPTDQYGSPGSSVSFTCEAQGVPAPVITWTRDHRPVQPSSRHFISVGGINLRVQHVKSSDEGEYVCRAQNAAGSVESSANLYVRDKVAPIIREEPRDVVVGAGEAEVVFPCRVEGRPRPVTVWRKDNAVLNVAGGKYRMDGDGSLHVFNVTVGDAGRYECSARNHVGFTSAQATLQVQEETQPHIGDEFLTESFEEARDQVDRALNDTISQLFRRDRTRPHNPHDLLRIFRFPTNEGREIARAAEKIEQTLKIVMSHVESGVVFNLTTYQYQDLLSPEKVFLLTNLSGCLAHRRVANCNDLCFNAKYRTLDGTCNNLKNPLWGASLTGFRRILPPVYENGFNTPVGWSKTKRYHGFFKPSARLVSTRVISTEDVSPDNHCTHMLMQWGQFLDHDLDHALPAVAAESFHDGVSCQRSCDYAPPCFPIEIPQDDPRVRHHRCMEFMRSSSVCGSGMTSVFYNTVLPREQINQLTAFIDASQVYGSSEAEMRLLRNRSPGSGLLREGILAPSGKPLMPFSDGAPVDCQRDVNESGVDCFLAGDIRANEQSGLTAMHTVWFREHNRIARQLHEINPHWEADQVYHEARKIVGAEMQHITYTHWMPHILGPSGMARLGPYRGYNETLNPGIANAFATAAFRFGHSLINPILHRLNATFQPISAGHLPLHKAFFSPWRIVEEGGVDPLLRGLFATPAKLKTPGQFLNSELTEKLFRAAHEIALDLAALNIQRGRDHALPAYVEWRRGCGLSVPETFQDMQDYITSQAVRDKLQQLYGHPGNVDAWVGGLLEDQVEGARVGPTFQCILLDQFRRLRDADRFWYENPSVFKAEQLAQLKQVSLGRVLCDNGDDLRDVTQDLFVLPREQSPAFVPCTSLPFVDLRLWGDCCSECKKPGLFNSVSIRFRREADQSLAEDRDHAMSTLHLNHSYAPLAVHQGEQYQLNDAPTTYKAQIVEADTKRPETTPREEEEDLTDFSAEDLAEERMEGLEDLVVQLSRTVRSLNAKVRGLERQCRREGRQGRVGREAGRKRRRACRDHRGRRRGPGEAWHQDRCTSCRCQNGEVKCSVETCPEPGCEEPVLGQDQCCPQCMP